MSASWPPPDGVTGAFDGASCPAVPAPAHLLIHATEGARQDGDRLAAVLRRWQAWAMKLARDRPSGPVTLQIVDLHGRPFYTTRQWQPMIDVPLPAGTYHVTVEHGCQRRRYTVTLNQGSTFNLHLRGSTALAGRVPI